MTWNGKARQGMVFEAKARHGKAWKDKAWECMAR